MPQRPVLVVDDDPTIRTLVADLLVEEGYLVVTAATGQEALDRVLASQPAALVLDLQLPGLDGRAVVEALREWVLQVPVLLVTANGQARRAAEDLGVESYLSKPFDLDALLAAVQRLAGDGLAA